MDDDQRYQQGLETRREVLGRKHVENALARADAFGSDFQDLITRYAWGDIWNREGLPRQTRSLLTIAMMVALNREGELKLHLRAAANCGVSRDQVKEVLMQAAIYCGVPAANAAFHAAREVYAEQDAAE